jgi:hypothetical protein
MIILISDFKSDRFGYYIPGGMHVSTVVCSNRVRENMTTMSIAEELVVHRDRVGENLFMVTRSEVGVSKTRVKENMTMMSMATLVVCRYRVEENLFIWWPVYCHHPPTQTFSISSNSTTQSHLLMKLMLEMLLVLLIRKLWVRKY